MLHFAVDLVVGGVFVLVYLGMILGEFPGLQLDRTGIALLGAIALSPPGGMTLQAAWAPIDVPTIALLLGLMVISAQFRLGGFYTAVTRRLGAADHTPTGLLALVVLTAGAALGHSRQRHRLPGDGAGALELCARRGLDPVPFLLALACASNVGSAGTLIGNPQNMLIGQALDLSFARYLLEGGVPALLGLGVVWAVLQLAYRERWYRSTSAAGGRRCTPFDRWQTIKGVAVVGGGDGGVPVQRRGRARWSRWPPPACCWSAARDGLARDAGPGRLAPAGALRRTVRGQRRGAAVRPLGGVFMALPQAPALDLAHAGGAVRRHRRALERRLECAGGDAAAAGGVAPARRRRSSRWPRRWPATCSSSAASPTSSSSTRRGGSAWRSTGRRMRASACR